MADKQEENFLKAHVFQKIAAAFIVAVAAVVTTLISNRFHSQSQKLKKELNDTKEQLDQAKATGSGLEVSLTTREKIIRIKFLGQDE